MEIVNIIFVYMLIFVIDIIIMKIIYPIYKAKEVIIIYGVKPFDIYSENPILWRNIKIIYIITFLFVNLVSIILIYHKFFNQNKKEIESKESLNKSEINFQKLTLLVGYSLNQNKKVYLPEYGLYQNFLITGTIGTGKTSSVMYPFTRQLIEYNSQHLSNKIGMLILDVKGNYYNQVKKYAKEYKVQNDLVVIELEGKFKYNPLHKPELKENIIANRLKTILNLFSENNTESYWIDKAEQVLTEAIKLCRLYNNGYVTFKEIHKIIVIDGYYKEKIEQIKEKFINNKLNEKQIYNFNTSLDFFQREFEKLDIRTLSILKSEITRITNVFISDYDIINTFSPKKEELNFRGFTDVINKGKIVVLNMNIAEYRNLSKVIAAYLKLDFQTEIMYLLSKGQQKTTAFICDEYSEYVTKNDSEFFSMSREAKCINIVSTQSYSSIKNTLKDETATKVICQNLINKIWFRTDDIYTIEEAQKQLGKEEKIKTSKNISENAKETNYNYITKSLNSKDSSISESYNVYTQTEYSYDTNYFTQNLRTFTSLAFLSDGSQILKPQKLEMLPYFKKEIER